MTDLARSQVTEFVPHELGAVFVISPVEEDHVQAHRGGTAARRAGGSVLLGVGAGGVEQRKGEQRARDRPMLRQAFFLAALVAGGGSRIPKAWSAEKR
ncbi:hypothetical protein WME97_43335 [Sorangium sp. So ce367]|uniref:hypothetical protein n=1 Tax=Sorangium sp. So ce367 TaxID=3133305 RepID=UPI003F60165F